MYRKIDRSGLTCNDKHYSLLMMRIKHFILLSAVSVITACNTRPDVRTGSSDYDPETGVTEPLNLRLCPMRVTNAPRTINGAVQRSSALACLNGVELLINPAPGACLSSGFGTRGRTHRGVDYHKRPAGNVVAAGDGVIRTLTYRQKDFGYWLILDHGANVYTAYGHLAGFDSTLKQGQFVKQGQLLGLMGKTGNATTGIHLHFEVRSGNINNAKGWWGLSPVNPFLLSAQCL